MQIIARAAIALWIIETIYFLHRDGWHWMAIYADEKMWDRIVMWMFDLSLLQFAIILFNIVYEKKRSAEDNWKHQNEKMKRFSDYANGEDQEGEEIK